jgi:hypothetical protein
MSAVVERLPEERSATWPAVAEAGVAALTQLVATFDEAAEEKDDATEEEEPVRGCHVALVSLHFKPVSPYKARFSRCHRASCHTRFLKGASKKVRLSKH